MTKHVFPLCGCEWKLHLGSYLHCCALNDQIVWAEEKKSHL